MPRNFHADTERLEALRLRLSKIISEISALESPKDKNLPLSINELKRVQLILELLKDDNSLFHYITQMFHLVKNMMNSLSRRFKDLTWDQKRLELQELLMEIFKFLGEKLSVVVYHWIGKGHNRKIAKSFQEKLGKLEKEFSVFGDGFGHKIIYNGPDEYFMYGTGRENITKMLATIKTCSRHDIISIGKQQKDTVTFEFSLKTLNSHIFALFVKRNALKKLKRWDLDKMTSVLTFPSLRKDVYTIVGDNSQVFSTLLDDLEIKRYLYEFAGLNSCGEGETKNYLLEEIICSDSTPIKPESVGDLKQDMKISFTFKIIMDQDEIDKMIRFILKIVDSVSTIGQLSRENISRISKIRIQAEESLRKESLGDIQEVLYKKKIQEKRLREEARLKLSPEEARKAEEKEKRREAKKNKAKMMKKGKMVVR